MAGISIQLGKVGRHWSIKLDVDGNVGSSTAFGCSDAMLPLVAGLLATEAQIAAIGAGTESQMGRAPSRITVTMPSGRVLTFKLALDKQAFSVPPEILSTLPGTAGEREPVESDP